MYAIQDAETRQTLHIGETGRGENTRFAEHVRDFEDKYDNDIALRHITTVDGKAAAKNIETRLIKTHEKIFGERPPFNFNDH